MYTFPRFCLHNHASQLCYHHSTFLQMSQQNNSSTEQDSKVPRLRFPEFEGEWEHKKMEQIAHRIGDGLHGTPKYQEETGYYFINGNNLIDGKIKLFDITKQVSEEEYKSYQKNLSENTILISINGTIGNIARYNSEKVMLGKSVGYFNFKKNPAFVYHILQTSKIQNHFVSELTGTTIKNLSLKTLRETPISYPTLPEQQKIAAFLTAVDTKIEQLTKKKTLLEQYKKGVMQGIFGQHHGLKGLKDDTDLAESKSEKSQNPSHLRFRQKDGTNYPDWEEKKLREVASFLRGSTLSKSDLEENGKNKCIHYGELFTKYHEVINNTISRTNAEGVRSKVGDILMPSSDVTPDGLARASSIQEKDVILGGDINVIRPNHINSIFLSYLLNFNKKKIIRIVTGTTVKHIYNKDVKMLEFNISKSAEEQTQIANFLSAIDDKIKLVSTQLANTQQFKKGLLQQMFV